MSDGHKRDVALVLSGGGANAAVMEVGFLRRLRESELWPRVGWIFGTSAGALTGLMAALDRLDDLERFILALRPEDTFRPHRLWRLPLLGLYDYTLPATIEERLGNLVETAADLRESPIEVVVIATDLGIEAGTGEESYELAYSSRTSPPEEMAQAILASAAVNAFVLPVRVGDRIASDGGWVRNFPLGYAYERPEVELIVSFRLMPRYPAFTTLPLQAMRRRLERLGRVPPVRAFITELKEAEERSGRGEPAHLADMLARLGRIAILRNSMLEERTAREKDESITELDSLRNDIHRLIETAVHDPVERAAAVREVEERFAAARFPFRHDRHVPRIAVLGSLGDDSLEPGLRAQKPWTEEAKRGLIARGYALTDAELRAAGA
jgi:predicted acylesterase/phospholipase RssA